MPAVDPTIEAAWIGAGVGGGVGFLGIVGTVVTSAVSSRNTRKATERTVEAGAAHTRATLAAAREDRLWDKQCAAYETTLADVRHRQMKRRNDLRGFRWDEKSEQQLKEFFEGYEAPGWFQTQARLLAYASPSVLDAFEASERAHLEVRKLYLRYSMMADDNREAAQTGRPGLAHDGRGTVDARHAVDPAVEAAEAADEGLIKLIRDELRSKPVAAMPPAILATKRRRLWRRH